MTVTVPAMNSTRRHFAIRFYGGMVRKSHTCPQILLNADHSACSVCAQRSKDGAVERDDLKEASEAGLLAPRSTS